MSPSGHRLWSAIGAARERLRREGLLAAIGLVLALVPTVLLVAWLAGGAGAWLAPSPLPMIVLIAALVVGVALAFWFGRRWVAGIDAALIAAAAEERRGLAPGSVRGVLELSRSLPQGASAALYREAEARLAGELSDASPWDIAGSMGERARQRRHRVMMALGGLGALAVVLGLVAPERTRMGWSPLLTPIAHLTPPSLAPLVVEPGDVELPRGSALSLQIRASGRSEVVVRWRAAGDVPRQRTVGVMDALATTRLASVDAPLDYWVVAPDGMVSDTFRVTPIDPLLVSDLIVDLIYPSYLNRSPERFEGEVPPLAIPAGTEIHVRGRATRRLHDVSLLREDGSTRVSLDVKADRFSGRWTPRSAGRFDWTLSDQDGESAEATPPPLEFTVVEDEAPQVSITFPGTDTLFGPEMRQDLVADARDDYGIRSASVVSWRTGKGGAAEPVEHELSVDGDREREILSAVLDFSDQQLVAGDTIHYFVRVVDNSPAGQVGESQTYTLRIPGRDELRSRAGEESSELADDAASLAESARELERATRDLARRAAHSARGRSSGSANPQGQPESASGEAAGGGEQQDVGYRELEEARQVLDRQESMVRGVEEMKRRTEAMREALEAAGLQDPELRERLDELRELYDEILSPELQEEMAKMRDGLEEMSPDEVQRALEQLAEQQKEMREQIEESAEMIRRASAEQEMNSLAREADELAEQQQALAETMAEESGSERDRTQQQEAMAQRAEELSERMDQLQESLSRLGEEQAAEQANEASQRTSEASQQAQQAAQDAGQQKNEQAGQRAEEAAAKLEQAAQTLQTAREEMSRARKDEAQQAMEQAANEALSLAQRQSELLDAMEEMQEAGEIGGEETAGQDQDGDDHQDGADAGQDADSQDQDTAAHGQPGQDSSQSGQQGQQGLDASKQGQQGQQGQDDAKDQKGQQGRGQQGQQGEGEGGKKGQGSDGEQGDQGSGNEGSGKEGGSGEGSKTGPLGQRSGGGLGGDGAASQSTEQLQSEQSALQQGLESLGRNVAEAGQRSATMNKDVGSALGRAMLSMQETVEGLQQSGETQRMPVDEARRSVESLNRLALALLESSEEGSPSQSEAGAQDALEQLAELTQEQGSLNGQANSLLPLELGPSTMGKRTQEMARRQNDIARKLGGMNDMAGGSEDLFGQLDELAKEAEAIAKELEGGRLTPEIVARQERLFHRLLDQGRTLEREEVGEERVGERPGDVGTSRADALDPDLLDSGPRYPVPSPEAMRDLPPAYRRLVLEYFDLLNRSVETNAVQSPGTDSPEGHER